RQPQRRQGGPGGATARFLSPYYLLPASPDFASAQAYVLAAQACLPVRIAGPANESYTTPASTSRTWRLSSASPLASGRGRRRSRAQQRQIVHIAADRSHGRDILE